MVNIANNAARLISSTVNEKTGTTVKKFVTQLEPGYTPDLLGTVVKYGDGISNQLHGIDTFVKLQDKTGKDLMKAMFSGDKLVLNGIASEAKTPGTHFNERFKNLLNSLKNNPTLDPASIGKKTDWAGNKPIEAILKAANKS